ncbi:hypothetical protein BKA65DRAFT_174746 [Rhexocercosporidium sp. MPI-PUGE-AT-0058]|nr:hypothetical protein BKA65DRAFT_174746 [Rhexocercosporidium sp. MPI-PUGE-AT-0058]
MSFTLHILPGALYTRRVLIYLAEKNLLQSLFLKISPPLPNVSAVHSTSHPSVLTTQPTAAKPKGSLPALTTPDGTTIHDSISIISYFEDLCDECENPSIHLESSTPNFPEANPSMRGQTIEEQARNAEIITLVDEATTLFERAARHGSAMFVLLQRQDITSSRIALQACRGVLAKVDGCYSHSLGLEGVEGGEDCGGVDGTATIADCLLFSLLEFAREMYGIDLVTGMEGLQRFQRAFGKRESVQVEGEQVWDGNLTKLASYWVKETDGISEWATERGKVGGLYLRALGSMALTALKRTAGLA